MLRVLGCRKPPCDSQNMMICRTRGKYPGQRTPNQRETRDRRPCAFIWLDISNESCLIPRCRHLKLPLDLLYYLQACTTDEAYQGWYDGYTSVLDSFTNASRSLRSGLFARQWLLGNTLLISHTGNLRISRVFDNIQIILLASRVVAQ